MRRLQCLVGIVYGRVMCPEVPQVIGLVCQTGRVTLMLGTYDFQILVEVLQGHVVVVPYVGGNPAQGEQGIGTQGVVGIIAHNDVGKMQCRLVIQGIAVLSLLHACLVGLPQIVVCQALFLLGRVRTLATYNGNKQYEGSGSQSDVVGDLDIEIKLNRSGAFRLNLFSHSADQYSNYLDNSQRNGVGLTYQTEFNSFRQFIRNMFASKKKRQENNLAEQQEILSGEKVEFSITGNNEIKTDIKKNDRK